MGIWYHFAILFEALFILTTVDAGTRVCRFMIQDLVGNAIPAFKETKSWSNNMIGSALACALWGYLLYAGVIDPLGGILTMWPLFGATNQMLAAIALTLCTVVLFKMKRERFAWVTVVPTAWLVDLHRDGGSGEGIRSESGGRLPQPCGQVRQRGGGQPGAGARQDACRYEPCHLQRLSRCDSRGLVGGDRGDHRDLCLSSISARR